MYVNEVEGSGEVLVSWSPSRELLIDSFLLCDVSPSLNVVEEQGLDNIVDRLRDESAKDLLDDEGMILASGQMLVWT